LFVDADAKHKQSNVGRQQARAEQTEKAPAEKKKKDEEVLKATQRAQAVSDAFIAGVEDGKESNRQLGSLTAILGQLVNRGRWRWWRWWRGGGGGGGNHHIHCRFCGKPRENDEFRAWSQIHCTLIKFSSLSCSWRLQLRKKKFQIKGKFYDENKYQGG
jgi:hypothetical protein